MEEGEGWGESLFPINRRDIKLQTKQPTAKSDPANSNSTVYDQWKLETWNIIDRVQQESVYTLGHWVIFHDRWLSNLSSGKVTKTYKYGDIIMADLGATNFGSELQYEHPCIVLVNDFTSMFVIPCTSVKPHKQKYSNEMDGLFADGFKKPTRIRLHDTRWIDKKRVTDHVGAVTNPALMQAIDDYIIGQFPAYRDKIHEMALIMNELFDQKALVTVTAQKLALAESELIEQKASLEKLKAKGELVEKYESLFHALERAVGAEAMAQAAAAAGVTLPR